MRTTSVARSVARARRPWTSTIAHNPPRAESLRRGASSRPGMAASALTTELPVAWSNLKGILFDVDGTLTHSDDLHFLAYKSLLIEYNYNGGQPITRLFYDATISGRHNPEIAADLLPERSEEERRAFSERKEALFRDLARAGLKPIPGLMELLKIVDDSGLRKIAVTNAPPANVELMLAAIGLDTYFEDVVYGEQCPRAKPHPDPYLIGMEKLGISPHEALIFEDSPSGIAAGVAAGVPVVALGTTQDFAILMKAGASLVVRDYHAVVDMLKLQGVASCAS